jgi:glycosyltransferase involved in cell wall biosynthesis
MAERYRWLYPRAIEAARGRRNGHGLLLIINNFSTGGAQSSARRLLTGLAAEGVRVRAAVLEEQPEYPTPGRRALTAAGVPVLALPPAGTVDPAQAVAGLLEDIDRDPPQAVLLWNALAQWKVLLADALLDIPVYDVSPGEMYFDSLERYFARPRSGLPYRTATDYGARLAGVVVKYEAEAARAAAMLGTAVHVIPNGVPVPVSPVVPARHPDGRLVFGTLARISPQKKLEDLLEALRRAQGRLPPHVLRIAGGVERGCEAYAGQLRRLADGLPVEWVGEVRDAGPFLRGLDYFVLVAEPAGCPNASLEAMAAGLAVVITDVGGAAEQVADGIAGRLVPRGDVAALGEALVELAGDAYIMAPCPSCFHRRRMAGVICFALLSSAGVQAGEVVQHFPANEPVSCMRTQWRVVWGVERHDGGSEVLFIREASFKRGPAEPEIKVLGDCRLAEIFVPYNDGTRIYDISAHDFPLVVLDKDFLGPPCITPGTIYDREGVKGDTGLVAAEVHDEHLRWMNTAEHGRRVRRGQSLAVWAVLNVANYRYIMLYQFRDDGLVGFRLGATAHNLRSSDADSTTHLHMGCWRINVELGDATKTRVSTVRLDTKAGKTVVEDLTKEARVKWVAKKFTRLRVTSTTAVNSHQPAHQLSYELIPVCMGSARYNGLEEKFTKHDLWVTRQRTHELKPRDLNVLESAECIVGQATTLWHHSPVLHVARDEDFGVKGTRSHHGVAITAWAGCDLKPRNYFSSTPLYP